jgi:hypothetical protein
MSITVLLMIMLVMLGFLVGIAVSMMHFFIDKIMDIQYTLQDILTELRKRNL